MKREMLEAIFSLPCWLPNTGISAGITSVSSEMELLYPYYLIALNLLQISIVTFNSLIIHAGEWHIVHQLPGKCWSSKWEQADSASDLNLFSLHKKKKRNPTATPRQHWWNGLTCWETLSSCSTCLQHWWLGQWVHRINECCPKLIWRSESLLGWDCMDVQT